MREIWQKIWQNTGGQHLWLCTGGLKDELGEVGQRAQVLASCVGDDVLAPELECFQPSQLANSHHACR